jgi:hypothetical protein
MRDQTERPRRPSGCPTAQGERGPSGELAQAQVLEALRLATSAGRREATSAAAPKRGQASPLPMSSAPPNAPLTEGYSRHPGQNDPPSDVVRTYSCQLGNRPPADIG